MLKLVYGDELYHHGVKGMRWGHRKARPMSVERARMMSSKQAYKTANKAYSKAFNQADRKAYQAYSLSKRKRAANTARWQNAYDAASAANKAKAQYKADKKAYKQTDEYKAKRAKAVKVGAAVAGTALATYGAYKLNKFVRGKNTEIRLKQGAKACEAYFNTSNDTKIRQNIRKNAQKGMLFKSKNAKIAAANQAENAYKAEIITRYLNNSASQAKNDSFATAARNVYKEHSREKTANKALKKIIRDAGL